MISEPFAYRERRVSLSTRTGPKDEREGGPGS